MQEGRQGRSVKSTGEMLQSCTTMLVYSGPIAADYKLRLCKPSHIPLTIIACIVEADYLGITRKVLEV